MFFKREYKYKNKIVKDPGNVKLLVTLIAIISLAIISSVYTKTSIFEFFGNIEQLGGIISEFGTALTSYESIKYFMSDVLPELIITFQIALFSSIVGIAISLFTTFLCSDILIKNKYIIWFFRNLFSIIRTIPILIYAALFVPFLGIGTIPGGVALSLLTVIVSTKLFSEFLDTIDKGPIENIEAIGGNKLEIFIYAIWPQFFGYFCSIFFYTLEVNIRASSILGWVGAGGIGIVYDNALSLLRYDRVFVIFLSILIIVSIVDLFSFFVKKKVA